MGANARSRTRACSELAEVRHCDYRDMRETDFDAVSSIGLTEHIGVENYPAYFELSQSKLRPAVCCSTTASPAPTTSRRSVAGGFIDRYVFPDGELTGSGRIITEIQNVGFEVLHAENFRHHYAMTLRDWCRNLVEHWDDAVAEVGLPHREGVGPVHGRLREWDSSRTTFSCITFWRPSRAAGRRRAARCGPWWKSPA